jgi:hypothetical protein
MSESKRSNYVSEWFGHRIYPSVVSSAKSLADQRASTCPFLSVVKKSVTPCVKNEKSRGVCTISSTSNGPRQDWVACPYRLIGSDLIDPIGRRLYGINDGESSFTTAGPTLQLPEVRARVERVMREGGRVFTYFDHKIGGEISVSATPNSPEMAFDVTLVELIRAKGGIGLGRFAILEVQTMDFHGSYGRAVGKLRNAIELHPRHFPAELRKNQWWAGDGIEGPNIANVFKRTFYQMMFKFNFGMAPSCAGTALALPASVWDSWQPFLAAPSLREEADGTFRLEAKKAAKSIGDIRGWICVVDLDADAPTTPSPMRITKTIGVTSAALASLALTAAPAAASAQLLSESGIYATLLRRLTAYWPAAVVPHVE